MTAEIVDATGMASTRLAEAVGYPGSSVAFAQLLSGMERDGLITREVRGKRTYRIALSAPVSIRTDSVRTGPNAEVALGEPPDPVPVAFPPVLDRTGIDRTGIDRTGIDYDGIDYDELARRVLVQLVRRLAELSPGELAALENLLSPPTARTGPAAMGTVSAVGQVS